MQSRLIVKNFGPIEFVDLDLRNVNVFIGPQASGKSALAKLYTIFKAPRKFLTNVNGSVKEPINAFKEVLEEYNIASFLNPETEIVFVSELHDLSYRNESILYEPKLLKKILHLEDLKENFELNQVQIKEEIAILFETFLLFRLRTRQLLEEGNKMNYKKSIKDYETFKNLNKNKFFEIINLLKDIKDLEQNLSANAALYIPSERNFINIVKNASLNLLLNNVPIPKHILSFGAELEKATIKEIDLSFIHQNLVYKSINGEDRIFTNIDHSIKLIEAASGIQSVLPILIPILSRDILSFQRSFVIEEPELNLFPLAQYELIKLLESSRREPLWEDSGAIHTYTTHSPYILSALNNLLYAYKVIDSKEENINELVKAITPANINPYYFTAYQINNGKAEDIFDRKTGLIKDNYIDDASDKMGDDFDALMELMK